MYITYRGIPQNCNLMWVWALSIVGTNWENDDDEPDVCIWFSQRWDFRALFAGQDAMNGWSNTFSVTEVVAQEMAGGCPIEFAAKIATCCSNPSASCWFCSLFYSFLRCELGTTVIFFFASLGSADIFWLKPAGYGIGKCIEKLSISAWLVPHLAYPIFTWKEARCIFWLTISGQKMTIRIFWSREPDVCWSRLRG